VFGRGGVPVNPPALVPSRAPRSVRIPSWFFGGAAVAVAAALLATGLGAPGTVQPGGPEQGQGADVGEAGPSYWVWEAAQVWHIPRPVPALLSASAAAPTRLARASTSYRIDAAVSGDLAVRWTFSETTTAPASTELELRLTDGLSGTANTLTVYVETQLGVRRAALTFLLYWDAGAVGPTGITVETMQADVLVCSAVGHCP
jgi:hypothetical protein